MYRQQQAMFPRLARTMSAQQASSSHHLLRALEDGGIEDVRAVLLGTPEALMRSSLLTASYDSRHALRTPLMAAARTGSYAIFTTIMNSIDRLFTRNRSKRTEEMRRQMLERDRDGFTVAMHAARAKHVVVLGSVLAEIARSDAFEALTSRDHKHMTLLMHAAAAGHAAGFQEVALAIEASITEPQLAEHMAMRSGDDQTLLMIAAASRDKMTFKACVDKLRFLITPHDFRILMRERDADGMTFLMHAANPKRADYSIPGQSPGAAAAASTRATTVPFPIRHMQRPTSAGAGPVSDAPSVLGPGGSEEVLRRHSLQRGVVCEGEHAQAQGEPAPAEGTRRSSSAGVAGESKLEAAPVYKGVQQMSARGDGLDVSLAESVAGSGTEEAAAGRGQEAVTTTVSPASAVAAAAVTASAAAVDGRRSRYGLDQRERQHQHQQEQPTAHREGLNVDGMDARVPVLKAAVTLNKECLWKEQVRDMLTATDSWGRTLLSHGILSGNSQVFEVTVEALRADVLDEEVDDLLEGADHYEKKQPLIMAKLAGGKEMESCVQKRLNNLKRDVEHRARASTFEAKIQSFIPGKLIVIFQLLLPEVPWNDPPYERLSLLLIMSFLAPVLAWASGLVHRKVQSPDGPLVRRSFVSYALSAPAMYVWGVGTSSIFEDGFGWPESRAAAVLAVGTIVIPALDGFANSQRVEQWNDKFSLSRWRFSKQADIAWKKARDKAAKKKADNAAVFGKVGAMLKAKRALLSNRGVPGEPAADCEPQQPAAPREKKEEDEEKAPVVTFSPSAAAPVAPIFEVAEQKSSEA